MLSLGAAAPATTRKSLLLLLLPSPQKSRARSPGTTIPSQHVTQDAELAAITPVASDKASNANAVHVAGRTFVTAACLHRCAQSNSHKGSWDYLVPPECQKIRWYGTSALFLLSLVLRREGDGPYHYFFRSSSPIPIPYKAQGRTLPLNKAGRAKSIRYICAGISLQPSAMQ